MWLVPFSQQKAVERIARDPIAGFLDEFFNWSLPWGHGTQMTRKDDSYVFMVPVPGAEAKDVEVELRNSTITVTAHVTDEDGDRHMRTSVMLPEDAASDKVQATVRNGMLKLQIDRNEHARPRKIAVN